jgi:hypothetical protein
MLAGIADLTLDVLVGEVLLRVQRLQRLAGDGAEKRIPLGLARLDLLQPLVGAADRFGLDGHGGDSR